MAAIDARIATTVFNVSGFKVSPKRFSEPLAFIVKLMSTPAPPATGKQPSKYRTPRVPIETPMFDSQGLMTRTWVIFFEKLGKYGTEDQIKDVIDANQPAAAADYEYATFVIYDTTVTDNATNVLPVRRGGTLVDAEIVPRYDTTADFQIDILVSLAGAPFSSRSSVFGFLKLYMPGLTPAGTIIKQDVFASNPFKIDTDDILSTDILTGGSLGTGIYTVVLKWKVA